MVVLRRTRNFGQIQGILGYWMCRMCLHLQDKRKEVRKELFDLSLGQRHCPAVEAERAALAIEKAGETTVL